MIIKKVKIAHIHVWDKKNKGDVGIVLAVQQLLRKKIDKKIFFLNFPIEVLKNLQPEEIKKINNCDAVVIGGGGIFYHYFLPFDPKIINALTPPIIIYGVGYIRESGAKKLNQSEINSLALLAKKAKLIGVRDYYTKNFLKKIGINGDAISLVGDPAIFLDEIQPRNFVLNTNLKIGFNLNYSGWLGFGKWQNDILFAYETTAKYFIKKYQANIFYLLHHPGEKRILCKLKIPNLTIVDFSSPKQKFFYGKLNLVIGMMLHSCVMAFGAGTPEINLAYDLRNSSFAKFINSPELLIRPRNLKSGKLLNAAKNVLRKEDKYRKKFKRIKERIWREQEIFLNKINNLLNE